MMAETASSNTFDLPTSCLPEATSLQTFEIFQGHDLTVKTYPLKTLKLDQLKNAGVTTSINHHKNEHKFNFHFYFDDPDALSLPFNIYAIMIVNSRGGSVFKDFTQSCFDPGIGFYPGQKVVIDDLKLELHQGEAYRVMIWGRK